MRRALRMLKLYYLGMPTLCRVGLDWRLHCNKRILFFGEIMQGVGWGFSYRFVWSCRFLQLFHGQSLHLE